MTLWQLDSRCVAMLKYLADSETVQTVHEIARIFNISVRSVYYDLGKINDWLQMHHISPVLIERSRGVYVTKIQSEKIKALLHNSESTPYYVISPKERHRLMLCAVLSSADPVYIDLLSQLCDVSRNTVFNDLRIVREKLNRYGLELNFENQQGYFVNGPLFQRRAVFLYYYGQLLPLLESGSYCSTSELAFLDHVAIDHIAEKLRDIERRLEVSYVEGMIHALAALIHVILVRQDVLDLQGIDTREITDTKEYLLVHEVMDFLPPNEQIYVAMHLLGSRVQINALYDSRAEQPGLVAIAEELVMEFESLAALEFDERDELISHIASHLAVSIYRYKFGIQIGNPLMADIIASYPDLFELTSKAARILKDRLRVPIPDAEIAYLTMHLGGYLRRNIQTQHTYRVLIVCPNGVSTASILRGEVEALHPNLQIVDVVGIDDIDNYLSQCDFIISTVDVNTSIPVIKVKPIITEDDRLRILSRIVKNNQFKKLQSGITYEAVMGVVGPYVDHEQLKRLKKDLYELFNPAPMVETPVRDTSIRLEDVLFANRISTVAACPGWIEAIEAVSEILLTESTIEPSYVEAMIAAVHRYGPYIIVRPDVAIAHALPKDGVNALSVAASFFDPPVAINGRPVKLMFVLAPIDKSSHLGIMKDFMRVISDDRLESILDLSDQNGLLRLVREATLQKGTVDVDD